MRRADMSHFDPEIAESDQLKQLLDSCNVDEIPKILKKIPPDRFSDAIHILDNEEVRFSKEKLLTFITLLKDRNLLEKVGQNLSANVFIYLIKKSKEGDLDLLPLLVGLNHLVFYDVLLLMDDEVLKRLRPEANTEPLRHQLTLFSHEIVYRLEDLTQKLKSLEIEIDGIIPTNISYADIDAFHEKFRTIGEEAHSNIKRITQALALSWNTNREDLIDMLSFQKECWKKYDALVIGTPGAEGFSPSGLYARLEEQLHAVFGNPSFSKDAKDLFDSEPSLEALVKFSVRYLQDYWEVGLLPEVVNPTDLEKYEKNTEPESEEKKAFLFLQVQKNLDVAGLKTVADVKKAQIFSKDMLRDYLRNRVPH